MAEPLKPRPFCRSGSKEQAASGVNMVGSPTAVDNVNDEGLQVEMPQLEDGLLQFDPQCCRHVSLIRVR